MLAAVTVATACVMDDAVAAGIARTPAGLEKTISVEHPTGEFSVDLALDPADPHKVVRAALLRTSALADARGSRKSRPPPGRPPERPTRRRPAGRHAGDLQNRA